MKLLRQSIDKNGGDVLVIPEDKDDLWAVYNVVAKGDEVEMLTTRNVKMPNGSSTRKTVKLRIKVESVEFTASEEAMRIKGRTVTQNEDVPQGSYHTAELKLKEKVKIYKDDWDQVALDTIHKACSVEEKAEVGAVVLEEGVAHICLVTDNMTVMRTKIEKSIPKKRRGDSSAHDKALNRFLDMTAESLLRNLDLDKLKAVLIISPGTTGQQLVDRIDDHKDKFVVAHASTGYLQGLDEALRSPELQKQLANTKFQRNVALFDEFSRLLNEDTDKAWYGDEEVAKAADIPGAVRTLMITDSLFKNDDVQKRRNYIELVEKVQENGGDVVNFSSLHETGEQLNQLTGIAVILNYPLPGLDEDEY